MISNIEFSILKFVFLYCFIIVSLPDYAQNQRKIDSLIEIINTTKQDTVKVKSYCSLSKLYRDYDPDKALLLSKLGLELATKNNYKAGVALCEINTGRILSDMSKYNESAEYFLKSLKLYEELNDHTGLMNCYYEMCILFESQGNYNNALNFNYKSLEIALNKGIKFSIAKCYNKYGVIYFKLSDFNKSMYYFLKSMGILEMANDIDGIANCCNNISLVYASQKMFLKAKEYASKSLKLADKSRNKYLMANGNLTMGNINLEINLLDSANYYFRNALYYYEVLKNENRIAGCYMNLGIVDKKKGDFSRAIDNYSQALKIMEKTNDKYSIVLIYENLSDLNNCLKNYKDAVRFAEKCILLAKEINSLNNISLAYKNISNANDSIGNLKKAYTYYKLYKTIQDSLFSKEKLKQISELEIKYQNIKKEKEIISLAWNLQIANLKFSRLIYFSVIALIIVVLLAVIIIVHRKRINEKMTCLKVFESEENEKRYFSEELHDGLIPLLNTIKKYCNKLGDCQNEIKKNELLESSKESINDAIQTSRDITNKITPGVINNYGLFEAIRKLHNMVLLHNIDFKFNVTGSEIRFDLTTEMALYRVISELINNTIKHARAKTIEIDIIVNESKLSILYKDDGNGFNFKKQFNNPDKGLGLINITNRIKLIDGMINFNSKIGYGTNVLIEINHQEVNKIERK